MARITFEPGSIDDLDELAATCVAGFETYVPFAPAGWHVPTLDEERAWFAAQLGLPGVWVEVAACGGHVAGHLVALPAAASRAPDPDPDLGHLLSLFVRPAHWGTGLAADLHARGLAAARDRGFRSMRLFTAAAHGRARRFYEREGWRPAGDPRPEPEFGMDIVEYRRPL